MKLALLQVILTDWIYKIKKRNRLKGFSKVRHHTVQSTREKHNGFRQRLKRAFGTGVFL